MDRIEVLDHGWVQLASFTQPAERHNITYLAAATPAGQWTGDLEVVRRARQSYDAEWRAGIDQLSDEKLINYLMRNRHTSPFEAVVFTFDVQAPIFVLRQWHRHRTWAYSEVSARYTELPEIFYVPALDQITTQSASNKQMRTSEPNELAGDIQEMLQDTCQLAFQNYRWALKWGCPRELARGMLPLNTYSRMSATVNLHNLFHFLALRLHEHAQYEIRVYAEAMLQLIEPIVPVSVAAFRKHVLGAAQDTARLQERVKFLEAWVEDAKQRYFEETGEHLE